MSQPILQPNRIEAWKPSVPGVAEVFHAQISDYGYPPHCHDTWTVLIVDQGAISYQLDKNACGAAGRTVAILPPGVVHDGRPATGSPGFHKRVLYLDNSVIPGNMIGTAVDRTNLTDEALRQEVGHLHNSLKADEDPFDGECRLALILERIRLHLSRNNQPIDQPKSLVANSLRALLDEHIVDSINLDSAAEQLGRSKAHLICSFSVTYGVSPHAYITGRRIDKARSLLLDGIAPATVATSVGFFDQAHFTRHFKRHTSTTPAHYAASHR